VITLSLIDTVAAVAFPVSGPGMTTPPPSATHVSPPLPVVSPPVIVTPPIDTVGAARPERSPIITTGPPPRMIVDDAPAPNNWTLFAISMPPANVPAPIRIVSLS
jgi:hypothetical protein